MLAVISPDLELNLKPSACTVRTYMQMFKRTESLLEVLKKKSASDLEELMGLSKKQAASHVERFKAFERLPPKQAVLLFGGKTLAADEFEDSDRKYIQTHLRILSGLYGVLRPYDDVRGVRDVPMGARLSTSRGEDLVEFWGDMISKHLAKDLAAASGGKPRPLILGLVSDQYWKAVQRDCFPKDADVRRVNFVSNDDADIRLAYGLLARHIIRQRIDDLASLKQFDADGWFFKGSSDTEIIFGRRGDSGPKPKSAKSRESKKSRDKRKRDSSASSASPVKRKRRNRSPSSDGSDKKAARKKDPKARVCSSSSASS